MESSHKYGYEGIMSGTYPDRLQQSHQNNGILNDEDILSMYRTDSESGSCLRESSVREPNPLGVDMTGSTISISHSNHIHIGAPPAVSTPQEIPTAGSFQNVSPPQSLDTMSLASSINSAKLVNQNFKNFSDQSSIDCEPPRRYSEGVNEALATSYQINMGSSRSTVSDHSSKGINDRTLARAMSTPSTISETSLAAANALELAHQNNPSRQSQITTDVKNSNNVQMGTQIVYNYYISEANDKAHSPHRSTVSLPETENLQSLPGLDVSNDLLADFREKLVSVYQTKTRSSPLPWHRGKQLIPMNEYYTQPQIFGVNKFGHKTAEMVDLLSILEEGNETRLLVEGEAGMGKTFLATKLAEEWAKGTHLKKFNILFLITLGDLLGSLQQYIMDELLPSYYEKERFDEVWKYCKSHPTEVLFVLDGYDELQRQDKNQIENLINNKDFSRSKVVVTCRPNILHVMEKTIVVSGFGQHQIVEFIGKYFRAGGNDIGGKSLSKIIEKDDQCWKLAKRPLFCVLLCMLYITGDMGDSLPKRQCDVMLQIILCLIKWNRKSDTNASIDFDALPPEYEKPFYCFGRLCVTALKNATSRFSEQDVQNVEGYDSKLKNLGFLYSDNESHALGEKKFWKPVHQTFLEYLAAFYIAKHIKECKGCKECREYGPLFQRCSEVLKFCVGILNNKAYKIFDSLRFPFIAKLPIMKLLHLLREAGPIPENCQAVARLLDQPVVEISTSEIEFEGWSFLLSMRFRKLNTLKIAWRIKSRSPDQESSFTEASETRYAEFFDALRNNESIRRFHVRAKHDGEAFSEEKISLFFKYFQKGLLKKNLQELEIKEMKMKASGHLRAALEATAYQSSKVKALQDLRVLKLNTFMKDGDLEGICEALQKSSPSLETLHLEGLEHGMAGFKSLVRLLKTNSNIHVLQISMNQSLLVNCFNSLDDDLNDYPPKKMMTEIERIPKEADRKSKRVYSQHAREMPSERSLNGSCPSISPVRETPTERSQSEGREPFGGRGVDPNKEFKYLFDKLSMKAGQWTVEANHYWYLRKYNTESRILLPLCVGGEHKSVFHFLFSALPETHVRSLTFLQAGLSLSQSDLICLGHAARKSTHLAVLNIEDLEKVKNYIPLLIGIGQSSSLTSVNLTSSRIVITDPAFEVVCSALGCNTSLKKLWLGRWQFNIQDVLEAQKQVIHLLTMWQVNLLDLRDCIFYVGSGYLKQPTSPVVAPIEAFFGQNSNSCCCKSMKTLNLDGVEVRELNQTPLRGHQLLNSLTKFSNLVSLDLSLSISPSKADQATLMDNKLISKFFNVISTDLMQLAELKLDYWQFALNFDSLGSELGSRLRLCRKLKKVQLQGVNESTKDPRPDGPGAWCKHTFLHQLISYLPSLDDLSLCNYKINGNYFDSETIIKLGSCLHSHFNHTPFSVTFFNMSPDVEKALYEELKSAKCSVKRIDGSRSLKSFEVKRSLISVKKIKVLSRPIPENL